MRRSRVSMLPDRGRHVPCPRAQETTTTAMGEKSDIQAVPSRGTDAPSHALPAIRKNFQYGPIDENPQDERIGGSKIEGCLLEAVLSPASRALEAFGFIHR